MNSFELLFSYNTNGTDGIVSSFEKESQTIRISHLEDLFLFFNTDLNELNNQLNSLFYTLFFEETPQQSKLNVLESIRKIFINFQHYYESKDLFDFLLIGIKDFLPCYYFSLINDYERQLIPQNLLSNLQQIVPLTSCNKEDIRNIVITVREYISQNPEANALLSNSINEGDLAYDIENDLLNNHFCIQESTDSTNLLLNVYPKRDALSSLKFYLLLYAQSFLKKYFCNKIEQVFSCIPRANIINGWTNSTINSFKNIFTQTIDTLAESTLIPSFTDHLYLLRKDIVDKFNISFNHFKQSLGNAKLYLSAISLLKEKYMSNQPSNILEDPTKYIIHSYDDYIVAQLAFLTYCYSSCKKSGLSDYFRLQLCPKCYNIHTTMCTCPCVNTRRKGITDKYVDIKANTFPPIKEKVNDVLKTTCNDNSTHDVYQDFLSKNAIFLDKFHSSYCTAIINDHSLTVFTEEINDFVEEYHQLIDDYLCKANKL